MNMLKSPCLGACDWACVIVVERLLVSRRRSLVAIGRPTTVVSQNG